MSQVNTISQLCLIAIILLWAVATIGTIDNATPTFTTIKQTASMAKTPERPADPAEVLIGERLFLETRFAQFFFANAKDLNLPLAIGDPVLNFTEAIDTVLPGTFAGQSINCRACHLVDEQKGMPGGGNRSYSDFARRTLLPLRPDGQIRTVRNSPPLVNASLPRPNGLLLHFDGEFASLTGLVKGTLTGRNYGWLPTEKALAITHIARVIREDNGQGELAQQFGGSYQKIFTGTDDAIPEEFRLPRRFRVAVATASDREILDAVAQLIAVYVESLVFAQNEQEEFNGSPYSLFLARNHLPRKPMEGESDTAYSRRLLNLIEQLTQPQFITSADGQLQLHPQEFQFGPLELAGLKLFLRTPSDATTIAAGNCATCHPAPHFTDFKFHNTGETQEEYDTIHGQGSFAQIFIPDFRTRQANFDAFLPPTPRHPQAQGPFLSIPSLDKPGLTDLGLWNIYANPDIPKPQQRITRLLCGEQPCPPAKALPRAIALFKTPGLLDLGHSAPYFHTGQKNTLAAVVDFYRRISVLARQGKIRNADPALSNININTSETMAITAFLQSLNEDYE
jgi:hypothetical protein